MRAIVIGGTGHIGSYLVPRLVRLGYEVVNISRGKRDPYHWHGAWKEVIQVLIDRGFEEAAGNFGKRIRELKPGIVIDLTCFTLESARQIAEAVRDETQHLLHCGTIWVHGPSVAVPTTEEAPRKPFGDYGIRKAAIEEYLLSETRLGRLAATVLHPGHIVGPGWEPLNPAGHFNPEVFARLGRGEELLLPNFGLETVHHVHADDVAQGFERAISRRSTSVGESFHIVSAAALTLKGYAEAVAAWFGQKPVLRFADWDTWKKSVSEEEASATWDHIARSPNCSIAKARELLSYSPRYSSLEAVYESLQWMIEHRIIAL
jgi:nucleoside-diphosphate-sugar epimerase